MPDQAKIAELRAAIAAGTTPLGPLTAHTIDTRDVRDLTDPEELGTRIMYRCRMRRISATEAMDAPGFMWHPADAGDALYACVHTERNGSDVTIPARGIAASDALVQGNNGTHGREDATMVEENEVRCLHMSEHGARCYLLAGHPGQHGAWDLQHGDHFWA